MVYPTVYQAFSMLIPLSILSFIYHGMGWYRMVRPTRYQHQASSMLIPLSFPSSCSTGWVGTEWHTTQVSSMLIPRGWHSIVCPIVLVVYQAPSMSILADYSILMYHRMEGSISNQLSAKFCPRSHNLNSEWSEDLVLSLKCTSISLCQERKLSGSKTWFQTRVITCAAFAAKVRLSTTSTISARPLKFLCSIIVHLHLRNYQFF